MLIWNGRNSEEFGARKGSNIFYILRAKDSNKVTLLPVWWYHDLLIFAYIGLSIAITLLTLQYKLYIYSHSIPVIRAQHGNCATLLAGKCGISLRYYNMFPMGPSYLDAHISALWYLPRYLLLCNVLHSSCFDFFSGVLFGSRTQWYWLGSYSRFASLFFR